MMPIRIFKRDEARDILSGRKKWVYMPILVGWKSETESIAIYVCAPVSAVIGYFNIDTIIEGTPEHVWEVTHDEAGISKRAFMREFRDARIMYALKVADRYTVEPPVTCAELLARPRKMRKSYLGEVNKIIDRARGVID